MFRTSIGILIQRVMSVIRKAPYEIDRGEYGRKGWLKRRAESLVNTGLSFKELNQARIQLGDLPNEEYFAKLEEGLTPAEIDLNRQFAMRLATAGVDETGRLPSLG